MPRPFQIVSLFIFSSAVFSSILAYSQTQTQAPAVVTFTLDFPASQPEHYSIRVQSDGSARYQSSGRLSADSDETDSFDLDFTVGAETRQKIFELAAKAGYFQKDVDSHHKSIAFTGKKTLTYGDARRSGESSYNYSPNPAVQDLTSLMQSLSATLEFGHRLQYDRQYQKLALDEELKRMEEMARTNQLIEVTAIQPILDQIVADPSVINVTRARAQRLLERAGVH
ncbi:MAG TPA: hypothetical protein VKI40_04580 [Terriglobales bacterium]|nr:hypothetical protein [Terriglobales bacterium]